MYIREYERTSRDENSTSGGAEVSTNRLKFFSSFPAALVHRPREKIQMYIMLRKFIFRMKCWFLKFLKFTSLKIF